MLSRPLNPALDLPLGLGQCAQPARAESVLEQEVVELFDALRDSLLRYIFSLGLPVADGEDVVQEVFLLLFRHLQLGRSRQNLRGWTFRVAHNLTLKRRHASRRQNPLGSEAEERLDPNPTAEEWLLFGEKQAQLTAVFRALPETDQRCLQLRAEGLRYREIADILGISLGSVSIYLTRSLERLGRAEGQSKS